MKATWTATIIACVGALALVAAAPAQAHPGHGHGLHGHGHGGDDGASDHGNGHGNGNGNAGGKHGSGSCEAASSTIMAFVDAACPCAGTDDGNGGTIAWKNHGQYVRCVAHAVRDATRQAGVKHRCGRGIVPCAAHSTCGKNGAVACVVTTTGTCTNGLCDDGETSCTADADCATSSCSVVSADACATSGGAPSPGSCCTASPSGAFLD